MPTPTNPPRPITALPIRLTPCPPPPDRVMVWDLPWPNRVADGDSDRVLYEKMRAVDTSQADEDSRRIWEAAAVRVRQSSRNRWRFDLRYHLTGHPRRYIKLIT